MSFEFAIEYPKVTEQTFVRFYEDANFLQDFFSDAKVHIFVCDENVLRLKFAADFFSHFAPQKNLDFGLDLDLENSHKNCSENFGEKIFEPKIFFDENKKNILVVLHSGEENKNFQSVLQILQAALDFNAQRSSVFVGIGGGVICDLTAFAASIFKRGALCELVPTTLVSMCDAAIGGKTGCDFLDYKNMIGSFFPAKKIHIATDFIFSLNEREFKSGLAEVIKTFLLYDKNLFLECEKNQEKILLRDKEILKKIIFSCAKLKSNVVEKDLTEKNIRMFLNLGHTFAHALESCAGLGEFSHGEAVAWGIARATDLSFSLGLCKSDFHSKVLKILRDYDYCTEKIHPKILKSFQEKSEKNENPQEILAQSLFEAMKKDKKNADSEVRFVLQKDFCENLVLKCKKEEIFNVLV